jgi:hypothetical protein
MQEALVGLYDERHDELSYLYPEHLFERPQKSSPGDSAGGSAWLDLRSLSGSIEPGGLRRADESRLRVTIAGACDRHIVCNGRCERSARRPQCAPLQQILRRSLLRRTPPRPARLRLSTLRPSRQATRLSLGRSIRSSSLAYATSTLPSACWATWSRPATRTLPTASPTTAQIRVPLASASAQPSFATLPRPSSTSPSWPRYCMKIPATTWKARVTTSSGAPSYAYYPAINRNFSDTAATFGGSLAGAAIGDFVAEFTDDVLQALHMEKKR